MALVAAVLATAGPAAADGGRPTSAPNGVTGVMQRHAGKAGRFDAPSTTAAIGGRLIAHGGPVMATHTVHAMYWFPPGYTLDPSWKGIVDGYLADVAADAGKTSNVFSVGEQYGVHYDATYGGSAVDTTPFPANGCNATTTTIAVCLSETQIFEELKSFVAAQGWPVDGVATPGRPTIHPTQLVLVYLPPNVADCFDAPYDNYCSADSSRQYYCAYHTAWVTSTTTYVWANMPYTWSLHGCQGGNFPSGNAAADTAVDVTSHEYIEALTDPYLDAWYDEGGYEIADKCQLDYGTALGGPLGRSYNQLVGAGAYYTQLEYDNRRADCYQLGAPTVGTFSPLAGAPGDTIDIHGSNFFGPVVVRFNGIASPAVTVDSPTELHATLPAGAVKGTITVQALGGAGKSDAAFEPPPAISLFDPVDGQAGATLVTLSGSAFSGATAVRFGGRTASFSVLSDTELTATAPSGFAGGKISVVTPGGTGVSKGSFFSTQVAAVAPAAATAGKMLTIGGQGLGSATLVEFGGGVSVAPSSATPTSLQVQVPPDAQVGRLVVHTPRVAVATAAAFKPLPAITGFSTNPNQAGDTVTVMGTNLYEPGGAAAKVGGLALSASALAPGATSFDVQLPLGAVSGALTFRNAAGAATSSERLLVRPTITGGPSPSHGAAGSSVVLTGRTFSGTTAVSFNGAPAQFAVGDSGTTLTVTVPAGAVSGAISVQNAGGEAQSGAFTVDPRVTGLSTSDGRAGDALTIRGTGLAGADSVEFGGGVSAIPSASSPTSVRVVVPAGAASGPVTVHVGAQAAVSPAAFTVRAG